MKDLELQIHLREINKVRKEMEKIGVSFSKRKYLDLVGMRLLSWSNKNFEQEGAEKKWPPLSPNTIVNRRGQSYKPLQDTGRLKQSFVYNVHRSANWVAMGSADKRTPWLHGGTGPRDIVPRKKPYLAFYVYGKWVFTKRVRNHKIPARPLIPSERLSTQIATDALEAYVEVIAAKANGKGRV